ncbi:hypothetical protein [Alteribacillus persepolensis]|uniref:hypothetical protein n=1 Tax=Alteribacillus persepolensis TaxID=568899 RepID=UPI000B845FC5|nr:hypothetical protein [Alteribacillus persepolensis]
MKKKQYDLEDSIVYCLEKHPGASAKKIVRFCKNTMETIPADEQSKATVYSRLRKMKKKQKVMNQANNWYLLMNKE